MNLAVFTTFLGQAGQVIEKGIGDFAAEYSTKWDGGGEGGLFLTGVVRWLVETYTVPDWVPLSSVINGTLGCNDVKHNYQCS